MSTALLAAFAATYPDVFEQFMRDAAEHVTLAGDSIVNEQPYHNHTVQ